MRVEGRCSACRPRSRTRTGRHARPRRAAAPPPRAQSEPIASREALEEAVAAPARRATAAAALGRLPTRPGVVRVLAPPGRPAARTSPVQATRRRVGGATSPTVKGVPRRPRSRAVLVAAGALAARRRRRALGGCPVFPAHEPWNQRVDTLPVASDSAALIASIGLDSHVHADFGSGLWDGVAHRHPVRRRARQEDAEVARLVRLRGRERQGAVSDPGATCRSRASLRDRRRPARAHPRPRHLPLYELYALHRQGRRLGGRLGRDLDPALERTPPGRLDVRRRGRPADPPRPRPLGRRRLHRRDQPRAPLHRRRARARPFL